jgi:peptidoglycan/LPS O-acetylase OafA/YrhL
VFGQGTNGPHDGGALWSYFTLTQIYHPGFQWTLGGLYIAWTLCIEVSFYVTLPLIAFVIRWIGRTMTDLSGRVRVQLVALGTMYVLTVAWRLVNLHYSGLATQRGWLQGYLDYFALGMAMAVVSSWLQLGGRMPMVLGWLARWPAASLFFAAELYFMEMRLGNPTFKDVFTTAQRMGQPVLFGLSAAFLLLPGVFGPAGQGLWRRFLGGRVMTLLGLVSFGIYLWHPIWLEAIRQLIAKKDFTSSFWPVLGAVLILTIASATLSYLLVEAPAMRFGRRLERSMKTSGRGPRDIVLESRPLKTSSVTAP